MPVGRREGQPDAEPVVLRLSDLRRDPRLSPLSSAASCAHAAGRRSGSDAVGAVSDHRDELSPQVLCAISPARPATSSARRSCSMRSGPKEWPLAQRAAHFWEKLGPQFVVNAVLFAGLAAAGVWWAYPLLWLLPLLTWHDGDHPHPQHRRACGGARTRAIPCATPAPRARISSSGCSSRPITSTITSSIICCSTCPATTCRASTAFSAKAGMRTRMEVQPNYAAVLRLATASQTIEDRPGELVSSVRRARAGSRGRRRSDRRAASSGPIRGREAVSLAIPQRGLTSRPRSVSYGLILMRERR